MRLVTGTPRVLTDLPDHARLRAIEAQRRLVDGVKAAWEQVPHHPVARDENLSMRRALAHLDTDAWDLVEDWAPWADLDTAEPGAFVLIDKATGTVLGTDVVLVAVADIGSDDTTIDEVCSDDSLARTMAERHGTALRGRIRPTA